MATEVERLAVLIEANTKSYERAMLRMQQQTNKAINGASKSMPKLDAALKSTQVNTANVAAQFQDIAVQLAGGQSPFQIALQQGTQLQMALGTGGGLRGAITALGGAFAQLVNPVGLATIAVIGLGGAAVQYFLGAGKDAKRLEDLLERQKTLIEAIRDVWPEAAEAAKAYGRVSVATIEADARSVTRGLEDELQASVEKVRASLEDLQQLQQLASEQGDSLPGFGAFEDAIASLLAEIQAGNPDIRAFRQQIDEIANANPDNSGIQALRDDLISTTDSSADLIEKLKSLGVSVRQLGADMIAESKRVDAYSAALRSLGSIALPSLTDREMALRDYRRALNTSGNREERDDAAAQYLLTLERITAAEQEAASRRQAGAGSSRDALKDVIEGLQFEGEQLQRNALQQQIYNELKRAGVSIDSEAGQKIAAMVTANEQLRASQEQLAETTRRTAAAFRSMGERAGDVLGQIIFEGGKAGDIIKRLLIDLAKAALSRSLGNLFASFAGGGAGGGFFGRIITGLFGGGAASAAGGNFGAPALASRIAPRSLQEPSMRGRVSLGRAGSPRESVVRVLIDEGPMFRPVIAQTAGAVSAMAVKRNNKAIPGMLADRQARGF